MQYVLLGLQQRRDVLFVHRPPPRASRNPGTFYTSIHNSVGFVYITIPWHIMLARRRWSDKAVVVPRRDSRVRDKQILRPIGRANVHNKRREGRVLERKAAAEAREGCDQHLWSLQEEPPWCIHLLFSGLQGKFTTLSTCCFISSKSALVGNLSFCQS